VCSKVFHVLSNPLSYLLTPPADTNILTPQSFIPYETAKCEARLAMYVIKMLHTIHVRHK
jgi:hypothetical protein